MGEIEEVVVVFMEFFFMWLYKKIIVYKDVNNKEKLFLYVYEFYNKVEIDVNNIGDKFFNCDIV